MLLIDAVLFLMIFGMAARMGKGDAPVTLRIHAVVPKDDHFEMFHAHAPGSFSANRSLEAAVTGSGAPQWIELHPPADAGTYLRIDLGNAQDSVLLMAVEWAIGRDRVEIPLQELLGDANHRNHLGTARPTDSGMMLPVLGPDPFVALADDQRQRIDRLRDMHRPVLPPVLAALLFVILLHTGMARSARLLRSITHAKHHELVLCLTFPLLLVLPALTIFHPGLNPAFAFTEKRDLSPFPELRGSDIGTFAPRFESWYRDHFGFRKALYRWNSWLHVRVLRTSPIPDAVLVGKDGWLFQYDAHTDRAYRGIPLFTFEQLEQLRIALEYRQQQLAKEGIAFYMLLAPMSADLHPEFVPDRIRRISPLTWNGQVADHFARYSTVPVIEPSAALRAAKQHRPIYFRTDMHWNPYGAYFGYRELIGRIAKDLPRVSTPWPLEKLSFKDTLDHEADLAEQLGLNDVLPRDLPRCVPTTPRKASFTGFLPRPSFKAYDRPHVMAQADTTLPRLLMFHDSFGVYMRELMSEHFSHSVFIWTNGYSAEAVKEHAPDVVVQEFVEMFVPIMANDSPPWP